MDSGSRRWCSVVGKVEVEHDGRRLKKKRMGWGWIIRFLLVSLLLKLSSDYFK